MRWRWLRPPRTPRGEEINEVDSGRLIVTHPSNWTGLEPDELLLQLGQPLPSRSQWIPYGEDGELRFTLQRRPGVKGDRWPDPVQVQYFHIDRGTGALPGQGWVNSVPVTLPMEE